MKNIGQVGFIAAAALAAGTLVPTPVSADPPCQANHVCGTVLTDDGLPVEGAQAIVSVSSPGSRVAEDRTDSNGFFEIEIPVEDRSSEYRIGIVAGVVKIDGYDDSREVARQMILCLDDATAASQGQSNAAYSVLEERTVFNATAYLGTRNTDNPFAGLAIPPGSCTEG